jgi:hypothetical protein
MLNVKEFQELVLKHENSPFTEDELKSMENVEAKIDGKIKSNLTQNHFTFEYDEIYQDKNDFDTIRKGKMYNEICRKYRAGGWKVKRDTDDGTSMHAWNYWIIEVKG